MTEFYRKTSHCAGCGQPGTYCLCSSGQPCDCRLLHTMGSGRLPGALDTFSDAAPAVVGDDQGELFGESA